MRDRTHDEAMVELYQENPAYAVELLNSIHEDGDESELLIVLRQIAKARGGEKIGQSQKERGRLYQVRDRTWASAQHLARQLPENPLPELPPCVRWFPATALLESVK